MTSLTDAGITVALPAGWDGQIRAAGQGAAIPLRVAGADAPAGDGTDAPAGEGVVLHAASFALPPERGDYGSGAVELMGGSDVLVCLLEHERAAADTALFAREGIPRLTPAMFSPQSMQRAIAGMAGTQHFFRVSGRPFCLYVVVGSWRTRPLGTSRRPRRLVPADHRLTRVTRVTAIAVLALLVPTAAPAGARPAVAATVTPPGMTTLIEHAAWSWFEDARVAFTAGGTTLSTSAVIGTASTTPAPGTVALAELDLPTGTRRLVDLGRGEPDDHNSASIYEASTGEVTTAWSRHHKDNLVRTQRRRTDGSWLRLQPVDVGRRTTYNNLRQAADASGNPVLYDFIRGERFDPEVIASADLGRTWTRLGRVLRDPADDPNTRPYVQYAAAHDGRIDLLATETHPSKSQTSVYHGYIESGLVHDSSGAVLGPLGSAVPVTSLTRVWAPEGSERAWTADIVRDPVSGAPTVVFSVRHTDDDHRYWYGRWDGTAWRIEEIAFAGSALYAAENHYTGLVALDPSDARHVVVSADVAPSTGVPLVSDADGKRHWELWDGRRAVGGTWTWTPITAHSTEDNLRPELAADPSGASALLWLRGTYTTYLAHDLDVVGVVRSSGGAPVVAGAGTWSPAVDVLPMPMARAGRARPVVGQLDGHVADDLLMVRAGTGPDDLFLGDDQRHPTPIATRSVDSDAVPIAGDFDGNGRTDVYWYAAGPATDSLWTTTALATFTRSRPQQVAGSYTPIPGDYDGDGRTDIYWYAPGAATDRLWTATATGSFTNTNPQQVSGSYTPIPGDYDGDGRTDIYWYAPGAATDRLWTATATGSFTNTNPQQVSGSYTPIPGDYDGDGRTDIYWYAPGAATDRLWTATATGSFTNTNPQQVSGSYTPIPGDYDGDGRTDIHWYAPTARDYLWWSEGTPLDRSEPAALDA